MVFEDKFDIVFLLAEIIDQLLLEDGLFAYFDLNEGFKILTAIKFDGDIESHTSSQCLGSGFKRF